MYMRLARSKVAGKHIEKVDYLLEERLWHCASLIGQTSPKQFADRLFELK